MKTQYSKIADVKTNATLFVSLHALVGDAVTSLVWRDLSSYKVTLVSPKRTGAYILDNNKRKNAYFSVVGNTLAISLEDMQRGEYRVTVLSVYGTNTRSQYIIDIVCDGEAGLTEVELEMVAVETIGDGSGDAFDPTEMEMEIAGKADGSIYRVGESDEAVVRSHGFSIVTGTQPQFAIDTHGNLVLYNEGTPVVLTPAKLAELVS